MSAGAPYAQSLSPMHSQYYLETSPMAPGRRSQPITSPTRVGSTYWSAIYSVSTPSFTKHPQILPSPCICACRNLSPNTDHLLCSTQTMVLPLHQVSLPNSCSTITWIITSSPHFPKSNGVIEWQLHTIKTALSTSQDSKVSIEDLLLDLHSTPIGPNMPSPQEILHNRTFQYRS